jgi:putative FmdB family regulatory protein
VPTYEYRCKACKAEMEIFHSMTEDARTECPECGAQELIRLISAGGAVLFKGSGFYETDYRSDSYKAGEKAAKKDSTKKSSSESSSSDSSSKSSDSSSSED